jgi:hypothetical protein
MSGARAAAFQSRRRRSQGDPSMTVSRLTCPACATVLKPTKPVPVGKKVKCPKCGEAFTAEEEAPRAPAAAAKSKPAAKKPAAEQPAPPKPAAAMDDDEEEGGTYGVVKEEEPEEESPRSRAKSEAKSEGKKKPKINYAPDTSLKDLRGPAVAILVGPSNGLLITGLVGFIGWLALLVLILIPKVFPISDEDAVEKDKPKQAYMVLPGVGMMARDLAGGPPPTDDAKDKEAAKKEAQAGATFLVVYGFDLGQLAQLDWDLFLVAMLPILVGMAYSFVLTLGAAKIQNLESRAWGITSSIMAMFPLNGGGVIIVLLIIFERLIENMIDDIDYMRQVELVLIGLICVAEALAGVLALMALLRKEVKAGYEYKAE